MPTPSTGLGEWLELLVQPAVILGGGALFLNLLNKRIDDLRGDLGKLDAKVDRLDAKLDRLLEQGRHGSWP